MTKITGIRRLDETTGKSGRSGDNWHMTWADDGKQYVALCDGEGWPDIPGHTGAAHNTRVYAMSGDAPHHRLEHLPGYPDLLSEKSPNCCRYYGFGIVAVGGCIYHFVSTPNYPFDRAGGRFVGAKLIYSSDHGRSWKNQDGSPLRWEPWEDRNRENMVFFYEPDEAFSLLTLLQMGRNYEHNTDGFVYIYAPNGNEEGNMNQLVMCRAAIGSILDRSSYEYFVSRGTDGTASWSRDINARGVVHTFPSGWVNSKVHPYAWHPSVAYNAPLKTYMMVNWGMGCDGDGMWFGKPSYLGFWTATQPWGPWTQVHEEQAWMPTGDPVARAYQPQISPGWIADDGRSFWLVFTDFQRVGDTSPYYCFNYQKVEVLTE